LFSTCYNQDIIFIFMQIDALGSVEFSEIRKKSGKSKWMGKFVFKHVQAVYIHYLSFNKQLLLMWDTQIHRKCHGFRLT